MSSFPHFPSDVEKPKNPADERVKVLGTNLASCVFGNYYFTVGGIGVGSFLKLRQNSWRPFIVFTMIGSVADLYYGYNAACIQQRNEYKQAVEAQKREKNNKISSTHT